MPRTKDGFFGFCSTMRREQYVWRDVRMANFSSDERNKKERRSMVAGSRSDGASGELANLPGRVSGNMGRRRNQEIKIPAGETASYADIARQIGAPKSFRAVAHACGANKLAVVIPCHRVVRSDGGLSGYRWGIERKRTLLNREKHTNAVR